MSIDIQADFENVERARDIDSDYLKTERENALVGGAVYRSPPTTPIDDAGDNLSYDKKRCQHCGEHVDDQTRDCFGDNNDILWHCFNCTTATAMKERAGVDPDHDPEDEY